MVVPCVNSKIFSAVIENFYSSYPQAPAPLLHARSLPWPSLHWDETFLPGIFWKKNFEAAESLARCSKIRALRTGDEAVTSPCTRWVCQAQSLPTRAAKNTKHRILVSANAAQQPALIHSLAAVWGEALGCWGKIGIHHLLKNSNPAWHLPSFSQVNKSGKCSQTWKLLVHKYHKEIPQVPNHHFHQPNKVEVEQDLVADNIMDYLPTGLNGIQIRPLNFLTPGAASGQSYSEFRIPASTKAKNTFPYSKIIILKSAFIIILLWALKRIILLQKWNYLNLPSLLFPREKRGFFYFIVDEAAICI